MMKRTRCGILALVIVPFMAFGQGQHTEPSGSEVLAMDAAEFRLHTTTLANPFFEGRAPGTRGNRIAAEYLEFRLRSLELEPAFGEGEGRTFRQEFQPTDARPPFGKTVLAAQEVSYSGGDRSMSLAPERDFKVLGYSGDGDVKGELAFAGYSIQKGPRGYATYLDEDALKGKIAIVLRYEPLNKDGESRWSDDFWTSAANLPTKLRSAVKAGAVGIVLVNPPGATEKKAAEDVLGGLDMGTEQLEVPVVMASRVAVDAMLANSGAGKTLTELTEGANEAGGVVNLGADVTLNVRVERPSTLTDNVGGVLRGKGGLADEWVVVGAHYDHVGYGPTGAQERYWGDIHPGADDNASGTAGTLLVARKLAEAYRAEAGPSEARSVLFLWFSAEESGLEGSRYFVKHPIMPLESISIMLNMDMIGRLREKGFEVGGTGTAKGLRQWSQAYWDGFGQPVGAKRVGASNSDHFSFHMREVPNLFVFTGLHRDYHTPTDTIETLNFEGGAKVADLMYRVALDVAVRPEKFEFTSDSRFEEDEEKAEAPADPHAAVAPDQPLSGVTGLRVRFGIMPGDYSGEEGVLVGGLSTPDVPAAKAGLQEGDVIVKWAGETVTTVERWMQLMAKNSPGDVVEIVYTRNGEERTTKAELAAPLGRPRE